MKNNNQKISEHSTASGFSSHYDEKAQLWFANHLYEHIMSNQLLS